MNGPQLTRRFTSAWARWDPANTRRHLLKCLILQVFDGAPRRIAIVRTHERTASNSASRPGLQSNLDPSKAAFSLAAFQVITYGRIEVFTEER